MWNSTFMKAIRWMLYIPLCLIVIALIQFLFGLLFVGIASLHLSVFWLIVGLFVLGGIFWGLFRMLSMGISMLTVFFCPDHKIGSYIFSILTFIGFVWAIIRLWTIQDDLKGDVLVGCIVITILYIQLGVMIIYAALSSNEE
jgi:hypothetical protein